MKSLVTILLGTVGFLPAMASEVRVQELVLTEEEVRDLSVPLENNGTQPVVLDANYPDVVLDGNYPNTLLDANYPDTVLDGRYPSLFLSADPIERLENADWQAIPAPEIRTGE